MKYDLFKYLVHSVNVTLDSLHGDTVLLKDIITNDLYDQLSLTTGPWIAGGFVREMISPTTKKTDIDIFCANDNQVELVIDILTHQYGDPIFESSSAVTFKVEVSLPGTGVTIDKIQVIKGFIFDSAEQLLEHFDFTICQFVTDLRDFVCGQFSLFDLGRKRLVINKLSFPVATLRRIIKYSEKGFYLCNGSASEFLQKVIDEPELLETRFFYVD